jgi:ketosteroid isomerase-like protein
MRTLLTAFFLIIAGAALADQPADVPPADRQAIEQVITDQIAAFRRDDGAGAFGYASPDLQLMFDNPARFMAMVRQGYQPVYRPRSLAFGDLLDVEGMLVQEVAVIGPDGQPRLAEYTMEREPDGSWKIAGCRLLEKPSPES